MPNIENNLKNKEKKDIIKNKSEKEVSLIDLVEEDTLELNKLISQSEILGSRLDNYDLPPLELLNAQEELSQIKQTEKEALDDWKETSEAIVANSEFQAAKESWRKSAEEQFGISDFNLELFRRTLFKKDAISNAFASGKDWNHIFDNMDEFTEGESYDEAVKAFEVMGELDTEIPGSVKALHEKFGITNFQRYPKDMLLSQLRDADSQKEIGLMIFATNDWNGAFDNQAEIWNKIYNEQKDDLNFRIIECGSNISLARQLIKIKQDFTKKVSLTFLSAHSEPEGFCLGGEDEKSGFISQEDIKKLSPKMKGIFSTDAQVVANACSSGAINGWVKDLSKETKIKAVGPDRPAAIEDIDFNGKEIVPKYYDTDIYSKYYRGFLLSKKKKVLAGQN